MNEKYEVNDVYLFLVDALILVLSTMEAILIVITISTCGIR